MLDIFQTINPLKKDQSKLVLHKAILISASNEN